ncbi:MAG: glycoside hydrolase family 31 protein [Caldilineaceae bacterium]
MQPPLTIVHTPYGNGSPYVPTLAERVPQDPVGGDMVTLWFLTTPGDATTSVTLYWTRNGRAQTPIGGRPQARFESFDQWVFELGVVEAGEEVTYRLEATAAAAQCVSATFSFVTRRLRQMADLAVVYSDKLAVSARLLDAEGRPGPQFTVSLAPSQPAVLQCTFAQEYGPISMTAKGGDFAIATDEGLELSHPTHSSELRLRWIHGGLNLPLQVRWLEEGDGTLVAAEITGALQPAEALVGFGERYDAVDQRGRTLDTVVYEQYKNHGNRSYLPVPFFMSSRGYGCHVEGTGRVHYDLGRSAPDRWRCLAFAGSQEQIAVNLFGGEPLAIVRTFTALVGRPSAPPPAWVFGPWMSSNEWNTQARVEQELTKTLALDIPATVLVIEAWSDETTFYIWNGAQYTSQSGDGAFRLEDFTFPPGGPWPDPKGMVDKLHAAHVQLVLWQIPALKAIDESHAQHEADIAHAVEHGYVMRRQNGELYRNPAFWFHDALIPDFTQDRAADWWLKKRAYLVEQLGVAGFKTDGGEHLQGHDVVAADGRRGSELANAYPNVYVGAYHRFAQRLRHGDAVTFSRAGYTGAGAFPAHWAGDENSTWEAYRRSLHAGLSSALSGVLFWGWDIGGFSEALPSAELYLRATAAAAFAPIMQYHSEYRQPGTPSKDRTPWHIQEHSGDARVVPIYRFFAQLRMQLIPYLTSEAAWCVANGEPLLRPLLLDNGYDPTTWRIVDQFRLGRDLLVAPIVEEGATERTLYLPVGEWQDFWTGASVEGGRWHTVPAPLDRIPVYLRGGAYIGIDLSPEPYH